MSCKKKGCSKSCTPAALYLHVPLCRSKCRYCDFYSLPSAGGLAEAFVSAAAEELHRRGGELASPLSSIFVGGGTPTVLGAERLGELLGLLKAFTGADTEFTVEANPGTVDRAVASVLADAGVTRVSLGAQSFDDAELAWLGRSHQARDVVTSVGSLREAGIEHLSIDLIYGLPDQDANRWQASVRRALDLGIEHLSCYALSVEANTPLAAAAASGQAVCSDDATQKACYEAAIELTSQAGLEHYEVSNFARPGCRCRHNLTYWHNDPYVGIGPAAASYIGGWRRINAPDLTAYLAAVSQGGSIPGTYEHLGIDGQLAETLMLGLRLTSGVDRRRIVRRFGVDPVDAMGAVIGRYHLQGALIVTDTHVRIAPEYYFASDTILADIVAAADKRR